MSSPPPCFCLPFLLLLLTFIESGNGPAVASGKGLAGEGGKTSIVFSTVGRSRYEFDIFSLPVPSSSQSSSGDFAELLLSDGLSVNYNGFFPTDPSSLLSLLPVSGQVTPSSADDGNNPLEALVYVSERNGSSNIYLNVYRSAAGGRSNRRSALDVPTGLNLPLLRPKGEARFSQRDRPSVYGEHLIYVSTHEAPGVPRKSWAAVYSTHIPSGETKRLTPPGVADFSPAVSPSGDWTTVASSGYRGYTGETRDLQTHIAVFRTRDGSERTVVVDHGGWPCWADDSTLYFHRLSDDGWWSIFKATAIGGGSPVAVDRVTPPGLHAFTPACGNGFLAMATRRPSSEFRHIELLDLASGVFVDVTRRVSPDAHHFNPFVSPDFARIGYHRCRGGATALLLENIQSPDSEISLFRLDGFFPSFSPDGGRIAYAGLPGLYVMNADGSGKREVFSGNAFATAWDWKRKGVIYTSHGPDFANESTEVDVISIAVGEDELGSPSPSIKKLTAGAQNNAFPSPSPDGKWVVFRSGRSGHKNLYIMDAVEGEAKELRQLTSGPWTDTMCSWSPDGEWIAFASDRDNPGGGSFSIFFVHPDGTGLRKVVQSGHGGRANHPYFSPDARRIVFTSDYAGVSAEIISTPNQFQPYGEIFVANVDGSEIRRLTHNAYEDGTPSWGPTFMKPADVGEHLPENYRCKFDDQRWLRSQARHTEEVTCLKSP
ncbi:unnamed protein product [Spirodela intermedia]|uniref:Uncharacterized protein n=1 Tax=Spirodela intermedia TaxID=51605 RepID=A0A7I8KHY4_SPIIN|nr:unnamed protein product [Spirodela intermedia]